jgi:endonuclease/exonuclease/phosphatase family metal-dependent hydrolase
MKLICLNTWGGRAGKEPMLGFFRKYADATDIFCLQEIWAGWYREYEETPAGGVPLRNDVVIAHGYQMISETLPGHTGYFHPHFYEHYGLASFVRQGVEVVADGEVYVFKEKGFVPKDDLGKHARNLQFLTLKLPQGLVTVINFHGLWNGLGKGDTDERLEQSRRLLDFTRTLEHPFVLIGDFNLTPGTESLAMIERDGLRNLITDYGITSTRTSFYKKDERYADYAFVSPGIKVNDFKVLPDEVSDHAPLYLDFDLG